MKSNLLVLLRMYNLLESNDSNRFISAKQLPCKSLSFFTVSVALESLFEDNYITIQEDNIGFFSITAEGLNYLYNNQNHIEEYKFALRNDLPITEPNVNRNSTVGAWRQPDEFGSLPPDAINEIRSLLKKILNETRQQNLRNADKADAEHRIRAAQEIIEAPNPLLGVIKRVAESFLHSFAGGLANRILDIIKSIS